MKKTMIALLLALALILSVFAIAEGTVEAAVETAEEAVAETAETTEEVTEEAAEEAVAAETAAEEAVTEEAAAEETAEEAVAEEAPVEPAEPDLALERYISAIKGLKVHAAADLKSDVVVCAILNQKVIVHAYEGAFAKISYESLGVTYEGYVWNGYLSDKTTKLYRPHKDDEPVIDLK